MTGIISGIRTRRVGLVLLSAVGLLLSSGLPASASLPDTSTPSLSLDRTIQTTPFINSSTSMRDGEGSAYVPIDNSLWLTEDHDNFVFETNPHTGEFKRVISNTAFQNAPLFGGGGVAGPNRTDDFEAMAYDAVNDWLFVFSGPCCTSSNLPTAFRLTRDGGGSFQVESYQPLSSTADYTAAAWNPADGQLYVGHTQLIHTYDYETNIAGDPFSVPNLSGILGFAFSSPEDTGGTDLFVTTNGERLRRVDWVTKTIVPGWTFDLTPFEVFDSRAVELIDDQFYVLDGYDPRPPGPLRFAVFVFDVLGPTPEPPVASFTASPTSGDAPLPVAFTDTSQGNPTSWLWDFGDGAISTVQSPNHTFSAPNTYTVTLTATNTEGSSVATAEIVATQAQPPTNLVGNPDFEVDTSGWGTAGSGNGVTLTRAQPGHGGLWAAHLTNTSTGKRKCVLNDAPNWVTTTAAGTYTASIWVRGDVAGALIKINIKETNGSTVVKSRVKNYTLSTSWQQITLSHAPLAPGSSSLDLQVFLPKAQAPPGTCFYADDASILKS